MRGTRHRHDDELGPDCDDTGEYEDGDELDCDDGDGDVYPGADEICHAVDLDCDGVDFNGCPDVEDFGSVHYLTVQGTTGGSGTSASTTTCTSGRALTGFNIWYVPPPGGIYGPLVTRLQGVCQQVYIQDIRASPRSRW